MKCNCNTIVKKEEKISQGMINRGLYGIDISSYFLTIYAKNAIINSS